MPTVVFYSAGGQTETLAATAGVTVRELLHSQGIPANAVLTWINGTVVAEQAPIGPDDRVEIRQVRHYDLDVTRKPTVRVLPSARPPDSPTTAAVSAASSPCSITDVAKICSM